MAHLVNKLSSSLPDQQIDVKSWSYHQGIPLADPEFSLPARIDIIFGADICGELFSGKKITGPFGTPLVLETALGYVILRPTDEHQSRAGVNFVIANQPDHDICVALRKFREMEEI